MSGAIAKKLLAERSRSAAPKQLHERKKGDSGAESGEPTSSKARPQARWRQDKQETASLRTGSGGAVSVSTQAAAAL